MPSTSSTYTWTQSERAAPASQLTLPPIASIQAQWKSPGQFRDLPCSRMIFGMKSFRLGPSLCWRPSNSFFRLAGIFFHWLSASLHCYSGCNSGIFVDFWDIQSSLEEHQVMTRRIRIIQYPCLGDLTCLKRLMIAIYSNDIHRSRYGHALSWVWWCLTLLLIQYFSGVIAGIGWRRTQSEGALDEERLDEVLQLSPSYNLLQCTTIQFSLVPYNLARVQLMNAETVLDYYIILYSYLFAQFTLTFWDPFLQ